MTKNEDEFSGDQEAQHSSERYKSENHMPHILLTGAGFSRNWGGFLATEAFEFLPFRGNSVPVRNQP
jgi:hypothetical protein